MLLIDLLSACLFLTSWILARRNFKLSHLTSSIWDFIVLISGFGLIWSLSSAFGITAIADMAFVVIIGLMIGLILLSAQEHVQPL